MKCPRCDMEQKCGCESCVSRMEPGTVVQVRVGAEDAACGYCGHTLNLNDWMDMEMDEADAARRLNERT